MATKKRPAKSTPKAKPTTVATTDIYEHKEATVSLRPDVGTQAQFKQKKPTQRYRYDSSLSPALEWDGQNPAREQGEALIAELIDLATSFTERSAVPASFNRDAESSERSVAAERSASASRLNQIALQLKALSRPFLNWAGKAERLSFDVPTLPLFVHERLSTEAIIQTLTGHRKPEQPRMFDLFADPQRSITDQVLKAYEYRDQWTNRMILGDSLAVMNSLLHYEHLAGQVQMIYMDPPYGIKYGSNFQPFVRRRDVKHNDDDDLTREPEMVQAYRDTWEIGLHSYLTCMRDRLLLCRELLAPSGSVFVQISDENLHHVREVMDEVFGAENFCAVISVKKTSGLSKGFLPITQDFLLWYSKTANFKYRQLFTDKMEDAAEDSHYSRDEDGRLVRLSDLTGPFNDVQSCLYEYSLNGQKFRPSRGRQWKTTEEGMDCLVKAGRIVQSANMLYYKRFGDDFPVSMVDDTWHDISGSIQSRADPKIYVVQTSTSAIQRCMLMTTDPGDLVFDPTCGSGTTAYVAEQWGRRWITADVSRVPLALARQRLLTATFPWFSLKDDDRGPAGGFIYKRKQNKKGEEVGGIVPHVTLKSIANNEPPAEEVLVDRPERLDKIVRVTGPFSFEASIPTAGDVEVPEVGPASRAGPGDDLPVGVSGKSASFPARPAGPPRLGGPTEETNRMLEVLRRSPVLRLDGNRTVTLHNVRPPAKSLTLSAEALVDATAPGQSFSLEDAAEEIIEQGGNRLPFSRKPVAFVFGPENAAVSEKLVKNAAMEAHAKSYTHLYVIGFAIQPHARQLVEQCEAVMDIAATYVQATPDLLMGDLLKNMRSSQIFSVCGLPEIEVRPFSRDANAERKASRSASASRLNGMFEVELLGLDVFDPTTMETQHRKGNDVPAWFLDTDYNDLCFHVCQAFFPRTSAWDNLKKALKGDYSESVWDHLAGTTSAPFEAGEHKQIAVKVIDDRGNELVVVKKL